MEKGRRKGKRGSGGRTAAPPLKEGIRVGRRNVTLFAVGLASILVGFIALAMGSTSISALLLVGGYLVLVPWAILAGPGGGRRSQDPTT